MKEERQCVSRFVHWAYIEHWQKYLEYRNREGVRFEAAITSMVRSVCSSLDSSRAKVLDIGCGFGGHFDKPNFGSYIGIDLSISLLTQHPLRGSADAQLIAGNVMQLNFNRMHYNFIIGSLVLNYIEDLEDLIRRLRREAVKFCFVLPNPEFDLHLGKVINGVAHLELGQGISFRYFSHSIERLLGALKPACNIKIEASPMIGEFQLPAYLCISGSW